MVVVERLPEHPPSADSSRDVVDLGWEDRARTRQRLRTRGGRELALKLTTGTRLPPGSVILVEDGWHVEVEARPEDVWVVRASERSWLLRVAWQIGNRHFPIAVGEDEIVVLYDHTLVELWHRLGVTATRDRRPFLAEGGSAHRHDE